MITLTVTIKTITAPDGRKAVAVEYNSHSVEPVQVPEQFMARMVMEGMDEAMQFAGSKMSTGLKSVKGKAGDPLVKSAGAGIVRDFLRERPK